MPERRTAGEPTLSPARARTLARLQAVDRRLAAVVEAVCATLLALIVLTVSASVFTRFVIFYPLNFADALAKYMLLWMVFLGTGLAFRSGEHIAVDFLARRCAGAAARSLAAAVAGAVSLFLLVVIWHGLRNAWNGRALHDPFVFGISMFVPYLAVPAGAMYALLQVNLSLAIRLLGGAAEDAGDPPSDGDGVDPHRGGTRSRVSAAPPERGPPNAGNRGGTRSRVSAVGPALRAGRMLKCDNVLAARPEVVPYPPRSSPVGSSSLPKTPYPRAPRC
jgi:TRAP-type C4-dicarboxylate transport system permease small subunit